MPRENIYGVDMNFHQAAKVRELDRTVGIHSIEKRNTALPHIAVTTLTMGRYQIWPSGVTTENPVEITEPDYYVCNICAHTWSTPEADHCENCRSDNLSVYNDHTEAEEHSQTILDASEAN